MKKLILALLISTSILSAGFFQEEDKQLHMTATGVIALFSSMIAKKYKCTDKEAFMIGLGTALTVGLAKEAYDNRDGGTGFDMRDIGADAIGGTLGAGTGLVLVRF